MVIGDFATALLPHKIVYKVIYEVAEKALVATTGSGLRLMSTEGSAPVPAIENGTATTAPNASLATAEGTNPTAEKKEADQEGQEGGNYQD